MAYLELKGVNKGYGSGEARTEVLRDINLSMEQGDFVAIVGYSGVGKTTLMSLIAGLIEPDEGSVTMDGQSVKGPSSDRGLVFQNYSLLPWLDVEGNVKMAVNQVFASESPAEKKKRVLEAVEMVNLTPALHKKPSELSGGMRQRTSVARTLAMRPKVLLLDEPLSALDALTRSVIQDQILDIWKKRNQTVILITNDVDEGLYMADRIIPLSMGPMATFGPEVLVDIERPRDRTKSNSDPKYKELRQEVISYLLNQKENERVSSSGKSVQLPNIKPMDISMAKPGWFVGLRPQKKKTLEAA